MDSPGDDGPSLTGMWRGLFSYPRFFEPNPFVAILVQSGAGISGTTHEPCQVGPGRGGVLYATLAGTRAGAAVSFVKAYDGSAGWTHAVSYKGRLSADGNEIEGRWHVPGVWSGRFLMLRAGKEQAAIQRKAMEPVGGNSGSK